MSKITYLPAALDKREAALDKREAELNLFYNNIILYEYEIRLKEETLDRKKIKIHLYTLLVFTTGFLTSFILFNIISV